MARRKRIVPAAYDPSAQPDVPPEAEASVASLAPQQASSEAQTAEIPSLTATDSQDGNSTETNPLKRAKADWNRRAVLDPLHAVLNCHDVGQWSLDEFRQTGDTTVKSSLDHFLASVAKTFDPPSTCVEIGSGAGRCTQALVQRFDYVIGTDISAVMLEAAKQNFALWGLDTAHVSFRESNGFDLSVVESGIADCVFSCITLMHIPSSDLQCAYIREVGRILKPSGIFAISLYDDWEEYRRLGMEWEVRRQAHDIMGWSEATWRELDTFETSIQTPVVFEDLVKALEESGLRLILNRGRGTHTWWLYGERV